MIYPKQNAALRLPRRPNTLAALCAAALMVILLLVACSRSILTDRADALPLPPTREPAISPEAAQALAEQVEAAFATPSAPGDLTVSEQQLTSYLALNVQDRRLRALRVWLTPQGAVVQALVATRREHTIIALLRPEARDGNPRVAIITAGWDEHALPRWLLASAEAAINDALADADLPAAVEQVILGEGWMRIVWARS